MKQEKPYGFAASAVSKRDLFQGPKMVPSDVAIKALLSSGVEVVVIIATIATWKWFDNPEYVSTIAVLFYLWFRTVIHKIIRWYAWQLEIKVSRETDQVTK